MNRRAGGVGVVGAEAEAEAEETADWSESRGRTVVVRRACDVSADGGGGSEASVLAIISSWAAAAGDTLGLKMPGPGPGPDGGTAGVKPAAAAGSITDACQRKQLDEP